MIMMSNSCSDHFLSHNNESFPCIFKLLLLCHDILSAFIKMIKKSFFYLPLLSEVIYFLRFLTIQGKGSNN